MPGGSLDEQQLPSVLSQRSARKLLEANGWTEERGGKHAVKMTKPGWRPITLPDHKRRDYSKGLTQAILKQAGLLSSQRDSGGAE